MRSPFDATGAVEFDLERGQVRLRDEAIVLVPMEALLQVCLAAGRSAARSLGREIGLGIGDAIRTRLTAAGDVGGLGASSLDAVIDHLAGEWSLHGIGQLSMERWGMALIIIVDGARGGSEYMCAGAIEGAIQAASEVEVHAGYLGREGAHARFFLGNASAVARVEEWSASGVGFGDALVRLHAETPGGEA